MLLIFVKPSNFDAIILDFWISWGSVTTQLGEMEDPVTVT